MQQVDIQFALSPQALPARLLLSCAFGLLLP